MSLFDALWLGIVQGLTEFLPVSSDGHLSLAHAILKQTGSEDLFFDLVLHLGTLVAVLWVFGKDLWKFIVEAIKGLAAIPKQGLKPALNENEGLRLFLVMFFALVPTAVIGLLLKKPVEGHAFSNQAICMMLMINGLTLWCSRYAPQLPPVEPGPFNAIGLTLTRAVLVGIAQGMAVLPGISRSGSTIVALLLLGTHRDRAAQFSFLMSVPAILGAFVLTMDRESVAIGLANPGPYLLGAVVAAAVGVVALKVVLNLLRAARFHHFAWYCWALGALSFVYFSFAERS